MTQVIMKQRQNMLVNRGSLLINLLKEPKNRLSKI